MTIITKNDAYSFTKLETEKTLLFTWKHVPGLEIDIFKSGIVEFAKLCSEFLPKKGIIDATKLDQESPAVTWLRGESQTEEEKYDAWWMHKIVPTYNSSQLVGLAVATGDPSAPGELPKAPEGVAFKMGYFADLKSSVDWQP